VDIAGIDPVIVEEVERETSELLCRLIRIDTSNPPGNETQVAELMAAWFAEAGLRGEIVGEPADRRSFVLRLQGSRPGPSLLLLAHEDVVPAEPAGWQVPPFAGVVKDGYVWGRGAVDIKNLVAAHAVAVRRLAAEGAPFAGTLVYACTADEEEGSVCGARWLLENRPDLVRTDYVINEGGGHFIMHGGAPVYVLETGEKGTAQFRIVVSGEGGHASVPLRGGNAVVGAAHVVEALAAHELPVAVDGSSAELVELLVDDAGLRARLRDPVRARAALRELATRDRGLADMVEPLYGSAFSPTIVRGNSEAVNVYPTRVEVLVDCRTLAGHDQREIEAEVRDALCGVDARWSFEWIGSPVRGNASRYPSPLSEAIRRVLQRHVPGARLANAHCVGFTDSNWFRDRLPGVVAYNFSPHVEEDYAAVTERYHNVDERISVRDLAFQALFAERLALEVLV
jgi:acetylornithine deacetylase/succinyl-diaminopimelate desuccinylase-like protein